MGNAVQFNPLKTRSDFENAALQILEPLAKKLSPGCARLHLGDTAQFIHIISRKWKPGPGLCGRLFR